MLIPKEVRLSTKDMSPIKIQAMIASQSLSTSRAKNKQTRKRVTILSGVINPDREKEEQLLLNK